MMQCVKENIPVDKIIIQTIFSESLPNAEYTKRKPKYQSELAIE